MLFAGAQVRLERKPQQSPGESARARKKLTRLRGQAGHAKRAPEGCTEAASGRRQASLAYLCPQRAGATCRPPSRVVHGVCRPAPPRARHKPGRAPWPWRESRAYTTFGQAWQAPSDAGAAPSGAAPAASESEGEVNAAMPREDRGKNITRVERPKRDLSQQQA